MKYYDKYRYLTTLDAVEDEQNWWLAGFEVNGIFSVSKKDKVVHFHKKSESADCLVRRYRYTFIHMDKIYFLPMFSRNIEIYDIKSRLFSVIKIPGDRSKAYGTIGYKVNDKYIYLFPAFCDEIPVRIDTDTMVCELVCVEWTDIAIRYTKDKKWFICNMAEVNEDIWYGVYGSNVLIKSSITDLQKISVIQLDKKYKIFHVDNIGDSKLLISMVDGSESVIYNTIKGIIESKISIEQIGKVANILSDENEIVIIPQYGKQLMLIKRDIGAIKIIDCNNEKMRCFSDKDECFYYGKMDEDKIYLYPYNTNVLTIINRKDMSISYEEWEIEKDATTKDIMAKYVIEDKDGIYYEKRCDIDNFLDNMIKGT